MKKNLIKIENLQKYEIEAKAKVTVDNLVFEKGTVSRIHFENHTFEDGTEGMVMKFFKENTIIAKLKTNEDYTLVTDPDNFSYEIIHTNQLYIDKDAVFYNPFCEETE
jgi:hypothetical protein